MIVDETRTAETERRRNGPEVLDDKGGIEAGGEEEERKEGRGKLKGGKRREESRNRGRGVEVQGCEKRGKD